MRLRSSDILWTKNSKKSNPFKKLNKDIECDVAIVGGGIIGALIAYYLSKKKNLRVALFDKGEIAAGSTSASTALVMYQLDVPLSQLIKNIGKEKAVRAYRVSKKAVASVKKIIKDLKIDKKYYLDKKVLDLASSIRDVDSLKKEYETLRKHGFKVQYLNEHQLFKKFKVKKPAGIITFGSAEVDPNILTHSLINSASRSGVDVYTHTQVISYRKDNKLVTKSGHIISAKKIIFATGYESQSYLKKKVVELKSSYVIASKPNRKVKKHFLRDYMVWETARPYLYIRTTTTGRIIVGGEDEDVVDPQKRDKLISKKSKILESKFEALFPELDFQPEYEWAATFGDTKDGIGYIGTPKGFEGAYVALGFGGNGITFGISAAEILTSLITGKKPKNLDIFAFYR